VYSGNQLAVKSSKRNFLQLCHQSKHRLTLSGFVLLYVLKYDMISGSNRLLVESFLWILWPFFSYLFLDWFHNLNPLKENLAPMYLSKSDGNSARAPYSKWPMKWNISGTWWDRRQARCHFPLILAFWIHWDCYFSVLRPPWPLN